jgi:MFS family permease
MDISSHQQSAVRIASARGKWILLTTVLGSGTVLLGSTVTNVALPRIGDDFHADLAVLQWTVNAYMLTLASLILLGGSLGDRFGRRRVFLLGVVWFAAASLLCGLGVRRQRLRQPSRCAPAVAGGAGPRLPRRRTSVAAGAVHPAPPGRGAAPGGGPGGPAGVAAHGPPTR